MGKKKKVMLPPQLPAEMDDEEIEVSDEDIKFVKKHPKSAGFLSQLDTKEIDRYVSRVADRKDDDELEARYEKRNRKSALQDLKEEGILVDSVDALPIKTLDGKLEYRTAKVSTAKDEADKQPTDDVDNTEDENLVKLTKAERRQKLKKMKKEAKNQKKEKANDDHVEDKCHSDILAEVEKELSAEERFTKNKLRLAELGKQLLENPESCIASLKELLDICNDKDHNIIILGLFSLLAVFKDIIPGYRIRLPTEKELEMVVSKVVKQTRFYETTLLRSYKAYLLRLVALEKKPVFHRAVVHCMCDLLTTVPHFNFRDSLLVTVVKNLSSSDDVVRKYCCDAIKSTFVNEGKHGGEATLEAVRLIASQVKQHNCVLHPDCLDVFLSLKFDEDLGKPDSVEEKVKVKGKKRKWRRYEEPSKIEGNKFKKSQQELRDKTREEVSADLKAVSFAPDKEDQRRMQSATLAAVFETYFRILKRSVDVSVLGSTSKSASSSNAFGDHPLLAPCLSGLAKFSHLINVDFMGDLMGCLKKLAGYDDNNTALTSQNNLSVSERLQCCVVAFKVMRSNLDALNVDLQEFFVQLYNLLLEYRPNRDQGEVLAEALKVMLWEGKQHDMQRAAAFVKRLATFTLSFGSAEAMAALVTVKHILLRNAKCRRLLENDAGGGSLSGLIGKYQPDAWDPNLSGALASVLWELSLLSKHYNPTISSMASSISTMASMDPSLTQAYLSNASPVEAFNDSSFEKLLSKPVVLKPPSSINRKRKRNNKSTNFVSDTYTGEDEIKSKFEDHFEVVKSITENVRLRSEMNRTMASISLYEKFAQQKKNNKVGVKVSEKKKKKRAKAF